MSKPFWYNIGLAAVVAANVGLIGYALI